MFFSSMKFILQAHVKFLGLSTALSSTRLSVGENILKEQNIQNYYKFYWSYSEFYLKVLIINNTDTENTFQTF